MGCWNETCGISKLPIFDNDEVIVILIARVPFFDPLKISHSLCYPTAFWSPIGFPIYARYNGYGWIEDTQQNPFLDWTLEFIDEKLVEREVGENPCHDIAVERGRLDVKYLGELIEEGRLLLNRPYGPKELGFLPVGAMMIRRDVYEGMLATFEDEIYVGGERNGYQTIRANYLTQKVRKACTQFISKLTYLDHPERAIGFMRMYEDMRFLGPYQELTNFLEIYPQHMDRYISELGRMITINSMMCQLRLHYGLSQGAGSQYGDLGHYARQNDLIGRIIAAKVKEQADEFAAD